MAQTPWFFEVTQVGWVYSTVADIHLDTTCTYLIRSRMNNHQLLLL